MPKILMGISPYFKLCPFINKKTCLACCICETLLYFDFACQFFQETEDICFSQPSTCVPLPPFDFLLFFKLEKLP